MVLIQFSFCSLILARSFLASIITKAIVSKLDKRSAVGGHIITAIKPSSIMPSDNSRLGMVRYIGIKNITWRVNSKIAAFIGWPLL